MYLWYHLKKKKKEFFCQSIVSQRFTVRHIFQSIHSLFSVNFPLHGKHLSSESLTIWKVSKKFVCSDNVFLLLFRALFWGDSNLVVTCNMFKDFPLGTLRIFQILKKIYWFYFFLCDAGIYVKLIHIQLVYHIFHQAHVPTVHCYFFTLSVK